MWLLRARSCPRIGYSLSLVFTALLYDCCYALCLIGEENKVQTLRQSLAKVTQQVSDIAGSWTQVCLTPKLVLFPTYCVTPHLDLKLQALILFFGSMYYSMWDLCTAFTSSPPSLFWTTHSFRLLFLPPQYNLVPRGHQWPPSCQANNNFSVLIILDLS